MNRSPIAWVARSQLAVLLSGLLALTPLLVTVILLVWVGGMVHRFVGQQSSVGRFLSSVGLHFATDETVAYLLGILVFLATAYLIGLMVRSRFRRHIEVLTDNTLRRIPLIGPVYDLSSRFVGMLNQREQTALQSMSPVWCMFGGDQGVAVLALMPNSEPVMLGDRAYLAVLVPTAPVPFGGGLLYVPSEWVRPAGFGMEKLVSVYVSMGVSPPTSTSADPPKPSRI